VAGEILARGDGSLRRLARGPGRAGRDPAWEGPRLPGGRGDRAGPARRAEAEPPPSGSGTWRRAALLRLRLRDLAVEEFHVLALGSQSQILADLLITRGILNSSLVHPRECFVRRSQKRRRESCGAQSSERRSHTLG